MRVFWKRLQTGIALATAAVLFTLGLIKYSANHSLQDFNKDIREHFAVRNENNFKLYHAREEIMHLPTLHKKVNKLGIYQHKQQLLGSMLDTRGVVGNFTGNITSELVFSFSPTAEQMFLKKVIDPNNEQKVYANSPAMIWDGSKFIVVMRMWLDKEHTAGKTKNVFSDNYLYKRTYNDKMEPLDTSGNVLGIPTRVLQSVGK